MMTHVDLVQADSDEGRDKASQLRSIWAEAESSDHSHHSLYYIKTRSTFSLALKLFAILRLVCKTRSTPQRQKRVFLVNLTTPTLLQNSTKGLGRVKVKGLRRVPNPVYKSIKLSARGLPGCPNRDEDSPPTRIKA